MTPARRLVAIFYADVAGYSRLTGADEVGTHRRVMAMLDDVTARITAAGGTVLRYAGDAVLAIFPSVVLAVDTSAAIQTELAERHGGLPEDEQVRIRIGINLGDVIEDRGEIYGEGVNLAARLEAAAEPGGLCISAAAHDQCRRKCTLTFRDGGEQSFKNIAVPVRVFHWSPGASTSVIAGRQADGSPSQRPAIAVLAFTNMSGDPEQEYFSDGIAEDIITELARFRSLTVIARNSSFHFKGRSPKVQDVGRELGAHFVVEGSVRKAGNRVRITAQLIDAATGNHIWADRYDRDLEDIFTVQDEVTRAIVGATTGELARHGYEAARAKRTSDLTAYDYLLRARWLQWRIASSRKDVVGLLEEALALDPDYAAAHMELAMAYAYGIHSEGYDWQEAAARARHHVERAFANDVSDPVAHATAAMAFILTADFDLAELHAERALALNSNDVMVLTMAGTTLCYLGDVARGLELTRISARLLPIDPYSNRSEPHFDSLYLSGNDAAAVTTFRGMHNPPPHMHIEAAAALAQLGRIEEAQATIASGMRTAPSTFEPTTFARNHIRMCKHEAQAERWRDGYRKAGLDV